MRKNIKISVISLCFFVFFSSRVMAENTTTTTTRISVNVGAVVDMENSVGKMMLSCIQMAISDFYQTNSHFQTRIHLHTRDSMGDVVGAAAAAIDLIKNVEVQAILGPTTSMEADFVINIGEKSQVPIISYSASSPSLTSTPSPYFFRATQNDSSQVNAIASIVNAFGWRQVVPIYVDTEFGQGIIPHLTDALQDIGTAIPFRSPISPVATDEEILKELYKLMSMQTRVFIVHMSYSLVSRFFAQVKASGIMQKGYVWIVTDGITNFLDSLDPSVIDSMEGVLGIRPYLPNSKELSNFRVRWRRNRFDDEQEKVLNIYGLWAYDATAALAMAIEKSRTETVSFGAKFESRNYSTDLSHLRVLRNGPNLIQELSNTKFKGLTGDHLFVNGQLPTSDFEIVNVIGERKRRIGFWTPRNGLVRDLETSTSTTSKNLGTSSSSKNLGTVIWPGISTSIPKGWEIPTNGRWLKIGVPVKIGFTEFLKVKREEDSIGSTPKITGYCIDVFDAVVEELPYALNYEYIPFANPDGGSAGTYNDLVYQVYNKSYDGVVGDATITSNRSLFVDFTLPYTESGVSMVVQIKDNNHKSAWIFLKPLTWDLWIATFSFFIFIGFSVWVLEHRVNEDFRGPPSHQAGTCFWFSFSTMVFVQKERLVSNLARTLAIIWFFVVLILTQSYTASLTSLLTVQKLLPTVTDVNQLIKNQENVGYLKGAFVLGILEDLGFQKSNLKTYNSAEELHELFLKGSKNGGISAAFDEVPYMKRFLAQYCSQYAMVEPTFLTAGFGFAFAKGSPLVSDISRALLKVKEGDKMKKIEETWFGKQKTCPDPNTSVSSNSLSLQSFWGLFLLAGLASIITLMVFLAMFLYEHRQVLISPDSDASTWSRIHDLFRIFDQKDLKSRTFKNSEQTSDSDFSPSP
ncbi:glutamate receptor 2.2 [Euphorbia peplus]|nr:glutamate receptor 2.2 [Euphorbia peplus]